MRPYQTQIKEWFNRFKNGQMSVESEARSGRPSTSRNEKLIEKVRQIVMEARRLTLREIVEKVEISRGSVHSVLTEDLCMRRVSARKAARHVDREGLAASPRQCSRSFRPCNQRFFGQKQYGTCATASLLS